MPLKIAVIGAGIAGSGLAYALDQSGYEAHIFEKNSHVGGNAKTTEWKEEDQIRVSGLSVLAWPDNYFRNYTLLLQSLGVATEKLRIQFFVTKSEHGKITAYFNQGGASPLREAFSTDLRRWERVHKFVDWVNWIARFGRPVCFFEASLFNPLNYISLHRLARIFGVSEEFWKLIFVGVHSSSFLTVDLNNVPALIAPVLEDIIGLEHGGTLTSWTTHSRDVFEAISDSFTHSSFHTNRGVESVSFQSDHSVLVRDVHGVEEEFDKVVFACDAISAREILGASASWWENKLLANVEYVEKYEQMFMEGIVHTDTTVLPEEHRQTIASSCANYVDMYHDIDEAGNRNIRYENTFNPSSWAPGLRGAARRVLITYGLDKRRKSIDPSKVLRTISNRRAHPCFHMKNLMICFLLHKIQAGHNKRVYYCGSYTTPGNGHELSLSSGLAVASMMGAEYPFNSKNRSYYDFMLLRKMMMTPYIIYSFLTRACALVGLAYCLYRRKYLIGMVKKYFLRYR